LAIALRIVPGPLRSVMLWGETVDISGGVAGCCVKSLPDESMVYLGRLLWEIPGKIPISADEGHKFLSLNPFSWYGPLHLWGWITIIAALFISGCLAVAYCSTARP